MELDIFNLRWVHKGSLFEEIDFDLLIEIFGQQVWDYDIIFGYEVETEEPSEDIKIVNTLNLIDIEKQTVLNALKLTDYIQKDAAAILGISARSLNYKISNWGLFHPDWKTNK